MLVSAESLIESDFAAFLAQTYESQDGFRRA